MKKQTQEFLQIGMTVTDNAYHKTSHVCVI